MVRYRWLLAEQLLRQGRVDDAVSLAEQSQGPALADPTEFVKWWSHLSRFVVECALARDLGEEGSRYLDETLQGLGDLIEGRPLAAVGIPDARILVDLAVATAQRLTAADPATDPFHVLRKLHEHKELGPRLETHPFWLEFQVEEVGTTLLAAVESQAIGEYALSAELLHDLGKLPAAARLFGSAFDPWLDAQGVHLMPPDLQATRIPAIVAALQKKMESSRRALLKDTRKQACERACLLAGRVCPARCVREEACRKQARRCRASCGRSGPHFMPPEFDVEPTAPEFFQCR